MSLDKVSKDMLVRIASLHDIPNGAVSIRTNGKSEIIKSTTNIEIEKKDDAPGINIYVHSSCKGEACHIPVVISENGLFDMVYNDFYIEDNAEVTIVAGCGVHSGDEAGHDGVHTFHIGKNAKVNYIENHLGVGAGKNKVLNPTTKIYMETGSSMDMHTTQIGGVDYSNRKTYARLKGDSCLNVYERIMTDRFNVAKTDFAVTLLDNSKCNIISRSVARGESEQTFKSSLVGKGEVFGHVECDGIVLDRSRVISNPKVTADSNLATLTHEAAIGKIARDQLVKLMTLGLTEKEAEEKIIQGFLK